MQQTDVAVDSEGIVRGFGEPLVTAIGATQLSGGDMQPDLGGTATRTADESVDRALISVNDLDIRRDGHAGRCGRGRRWRCGCRGNRLVHSSLTGLGRSSDG